MQIGIVIPPGAPIRRAMAAAIVVLVIVGVAAGVGRAFRAGEGLSRDPATRAATVRQDEALYGVFRQTSLIAAGTPRDVAMRKNFFDGQRKFEEYPVSTLLHVVPGVLFMVLGPLQLLRGLRSRFPLVHRWSGRVLLVTGIPLAGSALYIVWLAPGAGWRETAVVTVFALVFVVSGAMGWTAIRRGDRGRHREWMIRFLAAGLAISTVRLVAVLIAIAATRISVESAFVLSMVVGWVMTLGLAEAWIRATRRQSRPSTVPAPLIPV